MNLDEHNPIESELPSINLPSREDLLVAFNKTLTLISEDDNSEESDDEYLDFHEDDEDSEDHSNMPQFNFDIPKHLEDIFSSIKLKFEVDEYDPNEDEYFLLVSLELKLSKDEYREIYFDQRSNLALTISELNDDLKENTYLYVSEDDIELHQFFSVQTVTDEDGAEEGSIIIRLDPSKKPNSNDVLTIDLGSLGYNSSFSENSDFRNNEELVIKLGGNDKIISLGQPAEIFALGDKESEEKVFENLHRSIYLSFELINTIGKWLEELI